MSIEGRNSRRLRRETSHNTILSVLESNVVASAFLRFGRLLFLGSGIQRLNSSRSPGTQLLKEPVPAGQVDKRPLLQSCNCNTVTAEGTPHSNVRSGEGVADNEGTEKEVGIEALKERVEGLEVQSSESIQLRDPLVLL